MARHAKESPKPARTIPAKAVIISLLTMLLVGLLVAAILLVQNGVLTAVSTWLHPTTTEAIDNQPDTTTTTTSATSPSTAVTPEPISLVSLPEQVRGVRLTPGADFGTSHSGQETVQSQIDNLLDQLEEWDFNTILLPITENGQALYPSMVWERSSAVTDQVDAVRLLRESAAKRQITVIAVLDTGVYAGATSPLVPVDVTHLKQVAYEVAGYQFDAVLLTGYGFAYGAEPDEAAFAAQTTYATYAEFAQAAVENAVMQAATVLRSAYPQGQVGLLASAVWAHSTSNELGSQTSDCYEEYIDGFADVRSWVQTGDWDLVMVKNYTSTEHETVPFDNVLTWWDELCTDSQTPLYLEQGSHQVGGTDNQGWVSPDQLALQWVACETADSWHGSVFSSYEALLADQGDAIRVLLETIEGKAVMAYLADQLVITSPSSTSLTTTESSFSFQGSGDPNFPLLFNGKEIELSEEYGLFAVDVKLSIGTNTFTFSHKGKTVTYTIRYQVDLIKSVSPSSAIRLPGSAELSISAIALKGAKVYATVGGQTISMKEAPLKSDDTSTDEDSDYVNFAGTYTLPEGVEGETQALGAFTVYASYNGLSAQLSGGKLTVESEPTTTTTTTTTEPPTTATDEDGNPITTTSTTTTTGQAVSQATRSVDPSKGGATLASGKLVYISADYAETFTGSTVDDYSRPINAYLPAYTTDVIKKTVYDSSSGNSYYLLGSGRRVYTDTVKTYASSGTLTANTVTGGTATVSSTTTTLSLGSVWFVPYNVKLGGQSYPYESSVSYAITSYTASYVDITFSYTTAVKGKVDVSGSPLFTAAKWIAGSGNTYTLRLTLAKKGGFYGYSVSWMADGTLRFSFRHASDISQNSSSKPLSGLTIVVDAGHGGDWSGTYGAISGLYEKTLTLTYAKQLQSILKSLGATVVMTRTTDVRVELSEVTAITRAAQPDLFISIHMDGVSASSANGPSVHYFNEYSYDLASNIFSQMYSTYTSHKTTTKRGAVWDPFYVTRVHDCPAVLIECGFMTNPADLELLVNSSFQKELCQSIANGVVAYARSLS